MNDEQIKQKAKAYADNAMKVPAYTRAYDAYIAGAHSRDEEISRMQESLGECRRALFQLRNPWISVKDRLPKDGDIVLTRIVTIAEGGGESDESVRYHKQMYIGLWETDRMEHCRMAGILIDFISKVTHWMPIPELKK